jgi:hypothetical protein
VLKCLADGLRSKQPEVETEPRAQVAPGFGRLLTAVSGGVRININEVKGRIQAVVANLERHKDAARQALAELGAVRE